MQTAGLAFGSPECAEANTKERERQVGSQHRTKQDSGEALRIRNKQEIQSARSILPEDEEKVICEILPAPEFRIPSGGENTSSGGRSRDCNTTQNLTPPCTRHRMDETYDVDSPCDGSPGPSGSPGNYYNPPPNYGNYNTNNLSDVSYLSDSFPFEDSSLYHLNRPDSMIVSYDNSAIAEPLDDDSLHIKRVANVQSDTKTNQSPQGSRSFTNSSIEESFDIKCPAGSAPSYSYQQPNAGGSIFGTTFEIKQPGGNEAGSFPSAGNIYFDPYYTSSPVGRSRAPPGSAYGHIPRQDRTYNAGPNLNVTCPVADGGLNRTRVIGRPQDATYSCPASANRTRTVNRPRNLGQTFYYPPPADTTFTTMPALNTTMNVIRSPPNLGQRAPNLGQTYSCPQSADATFAMSGALNRTRNVVKSADLGETFTYPQQATGPCDLNRTRTVDRRPNLGQTFTCPPTTGACDLNRTRTIGQPNLGQTFTCPSSPTSPCDLNRTRTIDRQPNLGQTFTYPPGACDLNRTRTVDRQPNLAQTFTCPAADATFSMSPALNRTRNVIGSPPNLGGTFTMSPALNRTRNVVRSPQCLDETFYIPNKDETFNMSPILNRTRNVIRSPPHNETYSLSSEGTWGEMSSMSGPEGTMELSSMPSQDSGFDTSYMDSFPDRSCSFSPQRTHDLGETYTVSADDSGFPSSFMSGSSDRSYPEDIPGALRNLLNRSPDSMNESSYMSSSSDGSCPISPRSPMSPGSPRNIFNSTPRNLGDTYSIGSYAGNQSGPYPPAPHSQCMNLSSPVLERSYTPAPEEMRRTFTYPASDDSYEQSCELPSADDLETSREARRRQRHQAVMNRRLRALADLQASSHDSGLEDECSKSCERSPGGQDQWEENSYRDTPIEDHEYENEREWASDRAPFGHHPLDAGINSDWDQTPQFNFDFDQSQDPYNYYADADSSGPFMPVDEFDNYYSREPYYPRQLSTTRNLMHPIDSRHVISGTNLPYSRSSPFRGGYDPKESKIPKPGSRLPTRQLSRFPTNPSSALPFVPHNPERITAKKGARAPSLQQTRLAAAKARLVSKLPPSKLRELLPASIVDKLTKADMEPITDTDVKMPGEPACPVTRPSFLQRFDKRAEHEIEQHKKEDTIAIGPGLKDKPKILCESKKLAREKSKMLYHHRDEMLRASATAVDVSSALRKEMGNELVAVVDGLVHAETMCEYDAAVQAAEAAADAAAPDNAEIAAAEGAIGATRERSNQQEKDLKPKAKVDHLISVVCYVGNTFPQKKPTLDLSY